MKLNQSLYPNTKLILRDGILGNVKKQIAFPGKGHSELMPL